VIDKKMIDPCENENDKKNFHNSHYCSQQKQRASCKGSSLTTVRSSVTMTGRASVHSTDALPVIVDFTVVREAGVHHLSLDLSNNDNCNKYNYCLVFNLRNFNTYFSTQTTSVCTQPILI